MENHREFYVVPAIDIMDGKCVRLKQGLFNVKTVYHSSPLEVALDFEEKGFQRLHLVDLDGAKKGQRVNSKLIARICQKTKMIIDVGGGIRTLEGVKRYLDAGVDRVTVSTMAVKFKDELIRCFENFGTDKFILGADVKEERVAYSGWEETSPVNILEFIREYQALGILRILCTDVKKDGMLTGPSNHLYKKIIKTFREVKLIASGGVSQLKDIVRLKRIGVAEVIVGKAIYEKKINPVDLAKLSILNGDLDVG